MALRTRTLGSDLRVASIGLGCMGMSAFYGNRDAAESVATLRQAIESGVTLIDTADMYGNGDNEILVGSTIREMGVRDRIVLATKFANTWDPTTGARGPLRGDPTYVHQAVDASLRRLGVDHIDLYYQHRVDPNVPIEETVGAMAELVQAGKVRHLGLSEAGPETIRRAHRVHPITALQTEYSLWSREPEEVLLGLCRELGIGFVPYSPLGRGFLTGQITRIEDLEPDDARRNHPRFQGADFQHNIELVAKVKRLAGNKGCTPAQLALAWVLAQGDDIVPIPGTKRRPYLTENLASASIRLSSEELADIDRILPKQSFSGLRYPEAGMRSVDV